MAGDKLQSRKSIMFQIVARTYLVVWFTILFFQRDDSNAYRLILAAAIVGQVAVQIHDIRRFLRTPPVLDREF